MEVGTIGYAVYENGREYKGITNVTLPTLTALTTSLNGAGIAGNVEVAFKGYFDAMTLSMTLRQVSPENEAMTLPGMHTFDIRQAQQYQDEKTRATSVRSVKHVIVGTTKTSAGGTLAPVSTEDKNVEYSVSYWATWRDGKKTLEIDPTAFICIVDGVDLLADVRKALGR